MESNFVHSPISAKNPPSTTSTVTVLDSISESVDLLQTVHDYRKSILVQQTTAPSEVQTSKPTRRRPGQPTSTVGRRATSGSSCVSFSLPSGPKYRPFAAATSQQLLDQQRATAPAGGDTDDEEISGADDAIESETKLETQTEVKQPQRSALVHGKTAAQRCKYCYECQAAADSSLRLTTPLMRAGYSQVFSDSDIGSELTESGRHFAPDASAISAGNASAASATDNESAAFIVGKVGDDDDDDLDYSTRFLYGGLPPPPALFMTPSTAGAAEHETEQSIGQLGEGGSAMFDVVGTAASVRRQHRMKTAFSRSATVTGSLRHSQQQQQAQQHHWHRDSWTSLMADFCCSWTCSGAMSAAAVRGRESLRSRDRQTSCPCCHHEASARSSLAYRQRYRRRPQRKLLPPEMHTVGADGPATLCSGDDEVTFERGARDASTSSYGFCDIHQQQTETGGLTGSCGSNWTGRKTSGLPVGGLCSRTTCVVCILLAGVFVAVVGVVVGLMLVGPIVLHRTNWHAGHSAVTSDVERLSTGFHNISLSTFNVDDVMYNVPGGEWSTSFSTSVTDWPTGGWSSWAWYAGGSANGSRYRAFDRAMTYHAAQDSCRKLGGYVVRVDSIREQVFVENFLRHLLMWNATSIDAGLPGSAGGVGFWLGARRARGSHGDTCMFGQWKWVDPYGRTHGIISGFTAFIPGKPDNYYSPEECLFISYQDPEKEDRFLKWDDAPCDLNSVGGIKALCEVESSR